MPQFVTAPDRSAAPAAPAARGVTLGDLIVQALGRHSSSEAFIAGDRRITYAQVSALVSCYTALLARRGVGLGVGVTMLSPNMPESWIVQAATYLLGGRFSGLQAPASPHLRFVTGTVAPVDGGSSIGMGTVFESAAASESAASTPTT